MKSRSEIIADAYTAMNQGPLLPDTEVLDLLKQIVAGDVLPVRVDIGDADDLTRTLRVAVGNLLLHFAPSLKGGYGLASAYDMNNGRSGAPLLWDTDPVQELGPELGAQLTAILKALPAAPDPTKEKAQPAVVIVGGDPVHHSLMRLVANADMLTGAVVDTSRLSADDNPLKRLAHGLPAPKSVPKGLKDLPLTSEQRHLRGNPHRRRLKSRI